MVVQELIDALRGLPSDARIEAWHPSHDCGDFWVTAMTYDKHSRKVCLLANASEVSVAERVLHNDMESVNG